MADLLSAGVYFTETDKTIGTTAVASNVAAFAGVFEWGPVLDVTQVTNEPTLVERFGKPNDVTYASFFSAKNFLDYSNNLMLVRVAVAAQKNAVSTGTAIAINNMADYEATYADGSAAVGMFAAKYPGAMGNSLKVSMADSDTFSKTLTGTIAVASASNVLTGTGTAFDTQLAVGSFVTLTVGGSVVTKQVTAITSATVATVDSVYSAVGTGLTGVAKWEYYSYFGSAPVDSNKALDMGASKDGLHMVVVDEDGVFSGAVGSILETFENVSKASNAMKDDGSSGYYKTVLNNGKYVYWMDHPDTADMTGTALASAFGSAITSGAIYDTLKKPVSRSLVSGVSASTVTNGELQLGFDIFANTEKYDVRLIFTGKADKDVSRYVVQSIAETRLNSVAYVSPSKVADGTPLVGDTSDTLDEIIAWYESVNISSSYGFCDSGYKYQYDKYNDVYRWIPLNADIAGLAARTSDQAEAWFSPAGLNRGQIKNVTRLGYNPDKPARDELFKRNINPVVSFPGEGTVLFGDKTMLRRPSAFDAHGVRMLFIGLEMSIASMSKFYLFEQNTPLTRQLFAGSITPLLRDVKGRQGITDFFVDVGSTVNTPDTIDAGELRANIFIKPVRSIRFIRLSFVATRSSASFSELVV